MDLSATLAVAGIILALLWFGGKKRQKLPPGPFAWPFIGNLPLLEKEAPFKSFIEVSLGETFMCIFFVAFTRTHCFLTHMSMLFFPHSLAKPMVL